MYDLWVLNFIRDSSPRDWDRIVSCSRCNASFSRRKLIVFDQLMHITTFNFHDAAKFEPRRINGSLLSLTLLPAAVARLEGKRNGKSETRRATERSRWGNELQINSEHLHFCRRDEGAREDRKSQARGLVFRFSLRDIFPRRNSQRHIHVNCRNFLRDLFLKNYWSNYKLVSVKLAFL